MEEVTIKLPEQKNVSPDDLVVVHLLGFYGEITVLFTELEVGEFAGRLMKVRERSNGKD
jgi:hypothetical protein